MHLQCRHFFSAEKNYICLSWAIRCVFIGIEQIYTKKFLGSNEFVEKKPDNLEKYAKELKSYLIARG